MFAKNILAGFPHLPLPHPHTHVKPPWLRVAQRCPTKISTLSSLTQILEKATLISSTEARVGGFRG